MNFKRKFENNDSNKFINLANSDVIESKVWGMVCTGNGLGNECTFIWTWGYIFLKNNITYWLLAKSY